VQMTCADNLCTATYVAPADVPVPVTQTCGHACECSLKGDAGPPGG
jgi:hypothetical protein